jgi:hypothetical protein
VHPRVMLKTPFCENDRKKIIENSARVDTKTDFSHNVDINLGACTTKLYTVVIKSVPQARAFDTL